MERKQLVFDLERDNQMHISEDDIRYSKAILDLNEDEFEIEL